MSVQHNLLALQVADALLKELRSGNATWAHERLTPKTIRWQSMADWPRPDIAFEDRSTKTSLALEFKPPKQTKREYVTGLGQACTYLNEFEFSGLIVPERADDGYPIADYLRDTLSEVMAPVPIALFSYNTNPSTITAHRNLQTRDNPPDTLPRGSGKDMFWAYWRDVSAFEILELLRITDQTKRPSFNKTFERFWRNFACKGKARKWEGDFRKKKQPNQKSYAGEKTNAYLALRHTGLLDSQGALTSLGYRLMHTGRVYGPDSSAFLDLLAYIVMTEGQHIELIFWMDKTQRMIDPKDKECAATFYKTLDHALATEGVISPRRANAVKPTFVRDEFKLWNKLGLLQQKSTNRYFHQGYGLVFDWRKIVSIVDSHSDSL